MSELNIEARLEKELDDTLRKWTVVAEEVTEIKRGLRDVERRSQVLEQTALRQRLALFALQGELSLTERHAERYNRGRSKELREEKTV